MPDDTDGGDTGSSGEMQGGEADTAVSAVQGASMRATASAAGMERSTVIPITPA